ncbi:MAG: hypothetical protein GY913_14420 [Proteobacteria bacterium]|nr:hypothetical protein [Pseudomonadota bacterium]MCP4918104.1 hypothetical protein [Pseudomonadota bacterium]
MLLDGEDWLDDEGHDRFAVVLDMPLASSVSGTTHRDASTSESLAPVGDVFFDIM